jgi:hypothetical protein
VDLNAAMAEVVKDLNRTEHELALAGDAKGYRNAYRSAFHPAVPAVTCRSPAVRLQLDS